MKEEFKQFSWKKQWRFPWPVRGRCLLL